MMLTKALIGIDVPERSQKIFRHAADTRYECGWPRVAAESFEQADELGRPIGGQIDASEDFDRTKIIRGNFGPVGEETFSFSKERRVVPPDLRQDQRLEVQKPGVVRDVRQGVCQEAERIQGTTAPIISVGGPVPRGAPICARGVIAVENAADEGSSLHPIAAIPDQKNSLCQNCFT